MAPIPACTKKEIIAWSSVLFHFCQFCAFKVGTEYSSTACQFCTFTAETV